MEIIDDLLRRRVLDTSHGAFSRIAVLRSHASRQQQVQHDLAVRRDCVCVAVNEIYRGHCCDLVPYALPVAGKRKVHVITVAPYEDVGNLQRTTQSFR